MKEEIVTVQNETGIHARPAAQLTEFCKQFPQQITIKKGEETVNPKSIIGLMAAGITNGTTISVQVEGDDEEAIAKKIAHFISNLKG
ncbi:HPr family phosphocarrier protein [Pseudoramibacter alactolyticus]|jgi:phosphotransferase system HPr (HPr) family protein|uniref:HPr family phosphocarrier protein n=1 Tax=Pseudoramibacter alactolyticus TaxID=113287 RepID=UPI00248E03E8|nr:HPr family phosphocarrier protein [Pseudoramibacter alactolyticus]